MTGSDFTDRERAALDFFELFATDHHAIGDEEFQKLGRLFTTAEVVELCFRCTAIGVHRLMHVLDVFGKQEPALCYERGAIDATRAERPARGARADWTTRAESKSAPAPLTPLCRLVVRT
jgi:hypothetical protein